MYFIKTELKLYFPKKTILLFIFYILLSISAIVVASGMLYKTKLFDKFSVAIVNEDNSFESRSLINAFSYNQKGTMEIEGVSKESSRDKIKNGYSAVITIPRDFINDIKYGNSTNLKVNLNGEMPINSKVVSLFIDALTSQLASAQAGIYAVLREVPDSTFNNHLYQINFNFIKLFLERAEFFGTEVHSATGDLTIDLYYAIFLGLFFLTISGILFLDPFNISLSNKIQTRFAMSLIPFSKVYFLKFIVLCISFLPLSILFGLGLQYLGLNFNLTFLMSLLLLLLFLSSITSLVGSLFKESKAGGIILFLMSGASLFFSGGIAPLSFLPSAVEKISLFMPYYHLFSLFKESAVDNYSYFSIIVILFYILLFYFLGNTILRVRMCKFS